MISWNPQKVLDNWLGKTTIYHNAAENNLSPCYLYKDGEYISI